MSFLSKKPKKNKIYTLSQAMDLVSKNEGYSVVQEGIGFKIIPDNEANKHIAGYKTKMRQRKDFQSGIFIGSSHKVKQNDFNSNYERNSFSYRGEER